LRRRWLEWGAGILLGLALGVGVVAAFVLLGSEDTIDSPRISGLETAAPPQRNEDGGQPGRIRAVRVSGGAPPGSGPAQLAFRRGERVRFRVLTDIPLEIEIPGYGISRTVEAGDVVSFSADRAGQFPVIVAPSHINIATLRIVR
jgi:hypothetical protein